MTRGICKVEAGHSHIVNVVKTGNIVKTIDSTTEKVAATVEGVWID